MTSERERDQLWKKTGDREVIETVQKKIKEMLGEGVDLEMIEDIEIAEIEDMIEMIVIEIVAIVIVQVEMMRGTANIRDLTQDLNQDQDLHPHLLRLLRKNLVTLKQM